MFREAESTLFNPFYADSDLDLHQPTELPSVKTLLRKYKALRERNPVIFRSLIKLKTEKQ